jgi:hypothetical protein
VPGLGLPLLIIGILGLAAPWLAPPPRRAPLLILAAFAVLWYGLHELSPLKPFPGYPRYMLPLAPLLIILGAAFIYELARRMVGATSGLLAAAVMLAAALPALYLSLRINGPAQEDPRAVVPDAVSISAPRTGFDHYTRFARAEAEPSAPIRPTAADADLFVTSSFAYGRFLQFGAGPGQPERTRAKAAYYAEVFRRPYLEVTNGRPSYAFFNPVLRIVALAGQAERLAPIAAAIRARAPGLSVRLVEAGPSAP